MRFTLRIERTGALLYDRRERQYRPCSAAEAFLLISSRDGHWRRAHGLLAGELGDDEADLALGYMLEAGALDAGGLFPGRVVQLPALDGAFTAPLVAHLGVTLACNFSCAHCYSSSGKRAPNELTFTEIVALIDDLAAMGCMKLVLGGGEPFVRKDLVAIVKAADERGVDTFVHTNASLLKRDVLEQLAQCPPAGLSVSMDGPDAASNDVIRGEDAFAKTQAGLRLLRDHYTPGFNVSATVTPKNVATMPAMVDFAKAAGARLLLVRPAYPAGEAVKDDLQCDRETFARAVGAVHARARAIGMAVDAHDPDEETSVAFDGFGCVASRIVLGITPTGDVTPCLNLPDDFVSGNLRERPLLALWQGGATFSKLRDVTPNAQCASCRHYESCRGGCRVRALYAGNDLDGCDSWCHYEPREGEVAVRIERKARLNVLQP